MIRRLRPIVALGTGLCLVALFTGCAPASVGCPAIAWVNMVHVHLDGPGAAGASVQLCEGEHCTITADQRSTPPGQELIAPRFEPFIAIPASGGDWTITLGMAAPTPVTLRALDTAGTVLVEQELDLDWVRVGGTEQCGGPEEANPITLTIPAG